jgi:hypothetical protein
MDDTNPFNTKNIIIKENNKNKDLIEIYTCECNPKFNWKNKKTYLNHKKSKRHQNFENNNKEKNNRITLTKLQIEINKLKLENTKLKELFLESAKENLLLKNKLNIKNKDI